MREKILDSFIVLEGLDGAGTTTQMHALSRHYEATGRRYAITNEPSGYYFRSMRWYRIEGEGNNMCMDNLKFLLRIGPIKLFSYDRGGVLNKISNIEALKRLKDYNLDFDYIRKLPIQPHQNIPETAKNFNEISASPKDPKGFLINIKDNSLPEILEEFLKTKQKIN